MKHDPLEQNLREAAWHRPLTAAEQAQLDAWLAQRPEARADWEAELALNTALAHLPERPVASNFTARVLQAVEREDLAAVGGRKNSSRLGWLRSWGWVPRTAAAAVLLIAGMLLWQQVQHTREARAMERFVAAAEATDLPAPEIFQDYEAVLRIMPSGMADTALLTLMQ